MLSSWFMPRELTRGGCVYEIHSDYRNSRKVNYNRWSNYKEVDQLVAELVAGITSRKKGLYSKNMKVLVLELFHSAYTDPDQYIAYNRRSNHYDNIRKRFKAGEKYVYNPHISYDAFVGCVDLLRKGGYIVNSRGGSFYNAELGAYGFLSRMRATQKLKDLWTKHRITFEMVGVFKKNELLIQKDFPSEKTVNKGKPNEKKIKIKKEFNYTDNVHTNRLRRVVEAYNKLLEDTHIDCDAACMSEDDKNELIEKFKQYKKNQKPEIRVKLLRKSVYRVFNNRSWEQGGRFYGAWWIECSSILRRYITLNGEPTVELDYSGMHIQMLYAQKGINYAAWKQDPYTLDDGLPDRKLNKLILLTAINAETEHDTCSSVFDQLRKQSGMRERYNLTSHEPIKQKLKLLKLKHSRVADKIASGEGIHLQYLDSCIVEKLIIFCTSNRIPILTVHDSVVCPARYADLIQDKMWTYYNELMKRRYSLEVEYNNSKPFTKHIIHAVSKDSQPSRVASIIRTIVEMQPIKLDRATVKAWLKPDDIIEIDPDARSNRCAGNCNHTTRVNSYRQNKRCYLGAITVKLVRAEDGNGLSISIKD